MKKLLLLLLIISSISSIKASDTLTVRQVFNFNVGDTFDYRQHFAGDLAGPSFEIFDTYKRIIITGKSFSLNQDTLLYTYSQEGIQSPIHWYFNSTYTNLDSSILNYDFMIDSSVNQVDSFYNFSVSIIDSSNSNSYQSVLASYQPHPYAYGRYYTGSRTYIKGIGVYHLMDSSISGNPDNPGSPFTDYSTADLVYFSDGVHSFGTRTPYNVLAGISDLINQTVLHIFPNPTTGPLHLSLSEINQNYQFTLTDLLGKELLSQPITHSETAIDISQLANGIYTWRLTAENGIIKTGKVIKE